MMTNDDPRLFIEPATSMLVHARWNADEGWSLSIGSRTALELPSVSDEDREAPTTSYDRLTLAELMDALEAEARRRRQF